LSPSFRVEKGSIKDKIGMGPLLGCHLQDYGLASLAVHLA
jgi:hypothetical protein